jgi:fructokinase
VDLPVTDTIGAGDTFHGAFLAWLEIKEKMSRSAIVSLSEDELYSALYFANKAASIVCTRAGAEPPSRKEVEALKGPKEKPAGVKPKETKPSAKAKPATAKPAKETKLAKKPAEAKPAAAKKTPTKKK